jgi:hypothetical protein
LRTPASVSADCRKIGILKLLVVVDDEQLAGVGSRWCRVSLGRGATSGMPPAGRQPPR